MGTLDRAFIKAFSKARRSAPAVGPTVAPTTREPTPEPADRLASSDALFAEAPQACAEAPQACPVAPAASARRMLRFNLPASVAALQRCAQDQFAVLSDIVQRAQQQAGLKTLLFTSCYRGEGRTSLVLALARTLAAVSQARTLLVDGDLLNPQVSRQLRIDVPVGLDDVVLHGRSVGEALVYSEADGFTVLPLRDEVGEPRGFIRSEALAQTLATLKGEYDLILIDGSPVFSSLDPTVLHRQVDAAVLIVNREMTEDQSVARARTVLESAGLTVLGVAETFA